MKTAQRAAEKKTPGTLTVAKHRPLVNQLTLAQRRRLRQRQNFSTDVKPERFQ